MSVDTAAPAAPVAPAASPVAGPGGPRGWLRRNRGITVIVVIILLAVLLLSLLTARNATRGEALDPDNPHPSGAQAVARVVARHGVDVTVVRRAKQLAGTSIDRDTTVMVTSSQNLGRATAAQLHRRSVDAGTVVLAGPSTTLIEAFGLPLVAAEANVGRSTAAGCADPLVADLVLDVTPSIGYRDEQHRPGSDVEECFPGRGTRPGALLVRADKTSPVYAVGGTDLFTNGRVDRADNAAAALRLLGAHHRLVWYVPDRRDVAAGDTGSFAAQLPRGLVPALWLVAAAVLATMLWRGRRLGPLVVEPLPVTVKAVESTQGRGRLYRRVRDRPHAAAVLRAATMRRLVTLLRLPADSDPWQVAEAAARAAGREPWAVHEVLVLRPVGDDAALVRLAADLNALEKEVHDA
jgi:hypothetical protein